MRIFTFTYKENPGAAHIQNAKFITDLTNRINSDASLIEKAKKNNRGFAEEVRKIMSNTENDEYAFTMIEGRMLDAPRYSFLKNVECDGIKYDAEIDNLSRTFCLFEC